MSFITLLLVSCFITLGGASVRAVDFWDRRERSVLRGKPKDIMPSLPAAVHLVDSADIAPPVPSLRGSAMKNAHPLAALKAAGWVSGGHK